MPGKLRVLFLCVANSARSQMAEALMRHIQPDRYEVYSAGTQPGRVDPRAKAALEELGIATDKLRSKSLAEFEGEHFDYVITLCDKTAFECNSLPGAGEYIAWNFEDPSDRKIPNAYKKTLHEIHERIKMFNLVKNKH